MKFTRTTFYLRLCLVIFLCPCAQAQRIATGMAAVVNGFVVDITVTSGGSGYIDPPAVTISGGGGTGATAIAEVAHGMVTKIIITDAGKGYTNLPEVLISSPPMADGFNPNANTLLNGIKVQADGRILLGGGFLEITNREGQTRHLLVRVNSDGSLDEGFNYLAEAVDVGDPGFCELVFALEPSGKILLGRSGIGNRPISVRLASNGMVESEFSMNPQQAVGHLTAIAVQRDGEVLVCSPGWYSLKNYTHYLIRLNNLLFGGPSFRLNIGLNSKIMALVLQVDEKILIGGDFLSIEGRFDSKRMYFARTNPDLSIDQEFAPGVNGPVYSILVQPDGRILVAGWFGQIGGEVRSSIARLHPNGSLDRNFYTPYNPGANGAIRTMALQTDGKILVGGEFTTLGNHTRNFIARLNSDGSLDPGFNPGANGPVRVISMQADGKILVGGDFTLLGGAPRNRVGRLHNTDPATSSTTYDATSFTWFRGGASPELWRCTFEQSTDGTNWNVPVEGYPVTGGWKATNVFKFFGPYVRVRGYTGTGDIMETIWKSPAPVAFIAHDAIPSEGFIFNRVGPELRGYMGTSTVVDVSTNLMNWSPLPSTLLSPLEKLFVDPEAYGYPHRFYRLRSE